MTSESASASFIHLTHSFLARLLSEYSKRIPSQMKDEISEFQNLISSTNGWQQLAMFIDRMGCDKENNQRIANQNALQEFKLDSYRANAYKINPTNSELITNKDKDRNKDNENITKEKENVSIGIHEQDAGHYHFFKRFADNSSGSSGNYNEYRANSFYESGNDSNSNKHSEYTTTLHSIKSQSNFLPSFSDRYKDASFDKSKAKNSNSSSSSSLKIKLKPKGGVSRQLKQCIKNTMQLLKDNEPIINRLFQQLNQDHPEQSPQD